MQTYWSKVALSGRRDGKELYSFRIGLFCGDGLGASLQGDGHAGLHGGCIAARCTGLHQVDLAQAPNLVSLKNPFF